MAHTEGHFDIIVFVVLVFVCGGLSRILVRGTRLPYSIVMFVIGFGYGTLGMFYPHLNTYSTLTNAPDPELILYVFLPVLLFESAINLPIYVFRKVAGPCFFLACPGLALAALITAALMQLLFQQWPWAICLLFGFIISATDPVAVVALLRELGAPEGVSVLIEGESLFNDGTAILGYAVMVQVATHTFHGGAWDVALMFCTAFGGGFLVGLLCGFLFVTLLSFCTYEPNVEIILSFAAAYGTFYFAQHTCGVSGVIALVVCGIYMGMNYEACVTPESQELMSKVWDVSVLMANTLIFALVGVMVAEIWWDGIHSLGHVLQFVAVYLIVNVARALVIFVSYPLLRKSVGWRGCVLVAWGGLRGAVALVLGFLVYQNDDIDHHIGREFLAQAASVVVSTLVINGFFTKTIVHALRLDQVSDCKLIRHRAAVRMVKQTLKTSMETLKEDELLEDSNWWVVSKVAGSVLDKRAEQADISQTDLREMARVTFLDALQSSLSSQYKLGLLSVFGVNTLTGRLHQCLEDRGAKLEISLLQEMFHVPRWQAILAKVPILGVLIRQAITEKSAAYYDMALAYIVAIDNALRVCETHSLHHNTFSAPHLSTHHLSTGLLTKCPSEPPELLPFQRKCSQSPDLFERSPSMAPSVAEPLNRSRYRPIQPQAEQSPSGRTFSSEMEAIAEEYRKCRDDVMKDIQQMKKRSPTLARAVETHHAIRSVLNHGLCTVEELYAEGVVDRNTQETLMHILQERVSQASPAMFLPIASPLMFKLMTDEERQEFGLHPLMSATETTPLL